MEALVRATRSRQELHDMERIRVRVHQQVLSMEPAADPLNTDRAPLVLNTVHQVHSMDKVLALQDHSMDRVPPDHNMARVQVHNTDKEHPDHNTDKVLAHNTDKDQVHNTGKDQVRSMVRECLGPSTVLQACTTKVPDNIADLSTDKVQDHSMAQVNTTRVHNMGKVEINTDHLSMVSMVLNRVRAIPMDNIQVSMELE